MFDDRLTGYATGNLASPSTEELEHLRSMLPAGLTLIGRDASRLAPVIALEDLARALPVDVTATSSEEEHLTSRRSYTVRSG